MAEAQRTKESESPEVVNALAEVSASCPWTEDRATRFDALLSRLKNDSEKLLFFKLLGRSYYFDGRQTNLAAGAIAHQIEAEWKLNPDETCLIARDLDEKSSSADAAIQALRTQLNDDLWPGGQNILNSLKYAAESNEWKNIVLIDDYIGSGKKINKKISYIRSIQPFPKNIYICTFASQNILPYNIPNDCTFFCYKKLEKGISGTETEEQELSDLNTISDISTRFHKLKKPYHYGFEKTEALFLPENLNCPNNVFGIFWHKAYNSKYDKPLFPRAKK